MIINPISKGGKGLLPEIIVTAPSGSTLDLMQGSVVLQTYTLSSTETQHTFTVKNTGTYTVRGTSGSDTASVEVVVDVIGQFNCTIEYSNDLKLYWYGDECEDVTGGWDTRLGGTFTESSNVSYPWTKANISKETDHITCSMGSAGQSIFAPNNPVDMTGFSKICIEYSAYASGESGGGTVVAITSIDSYPYDNVLWQRADDGNHTDLLIEKAVWNGTQSFNADHSTKTFDISRLDYKYIGISLQRYRASLSFTLHKLWFE